MLSTLILLVLAAPSTLAQVNGYLQNRDPGDPPRVDLNQLQEQAFVMGSGEAYRDLLTIGASQAVADFAVRHERAEKYTVREFAKIRFLVVHPSCNTVLVKIDAKPVHQT